MPRKKLLFVVNNFNIGGPQKSLLSLLYNLDFQKYEVDIMSLSNTGTLLKFLPKEVKVIQTDNLVSYSILTPNNILKKSIKVLFSQNYTNAFLALQSIGKGLINKKMVQEKQEYWVNVKENLPKLKKKYDYAFGVSGGHSIMYIADCVKANEKIGWIRSDYRTLKRNNEIDRKYFREMDKILSVSVICKEIFLEIFPEAFSKTEVFYNILPFKMYENLPANTKQMEFEDTTKLLTICRLDPNKGLDLAIDALEILLKKNKNIKWFILGEGSYRKELEKLIKKKNLEEHFILLGFQLNTAAFMKKADIIVHPSRFEGKSNVVDEAKYLLKPIVATRYNTVEEQLTHENTGLISEMNSHSLSENIERLIASPSLKVKLKSNLEITRTSDSQSIQKFNEIVS